MVRDTIEATLSGVLNDSTENAWVRALEAMGLVRYRSSIAHSGYVRALAAYHQRSFSFQRALLEAVYGLAPGEFIGEVSMIGRETSEPGIFAMAALYVVRGEPGEALALRSLLREKFGEPEPHPVLRRLDAALSEGGMERGAVRAPLTELLAAPFDGLPVLFSFQRSDRRFPGLVVVRDSERKFVRERDGTFFAAAQLGLSPSGFPGYLAGGDTPQGVLSFRGFGSSDNVYVGPTPTILLALPYEVDPREFFHNPVADTLWTRGQYAALLPEPWRADPEMYEAYDAGEAGRAGVFAHGTTVDPSFAEGEPYWPNSPSAGCLKAAEVWSEVTGAREWSDQQRLIDAVRSTGGEAGFCVVVVLDNARDAVTLDEVAPLLEKAEAVQLRR
jgi:hypothetical protein